MGVPLLVMGLAGAAIGGIGAYESGQATKSAADYQAQVARNNATIAGENAAMTAGAGEAKVSAEGMKTAATVGSTKAAQGASNIDVNTGSAANVRSAEGKIGALDALTIRSNTAREAYGYQVSGVSSKAQAGLDVMEGDSAATAGDIGGLSTFLSGASSVGSNYARMQLGTGNTVGTN